MFASARFHFLQSISCLLPSISKRIWLPTPQNLLAPGTSKLGPRHLVKYKTKTKKHQQTSQSLTQRLKCQSWNGTKEARTELRRLECFQNGIGTANICLQISNQTNYNQTPNFTHKKKTSKKCLFVPGILGRFPEIQPTMRQKQAWTVWNQ